MATWMQWREKVQKQSDYLKWKQGIGHKSTQTPSPIGLLKPTACCIKMALHPTLHTVSFDALAEKYGAVDFQDALADFIARSNNPNISVSA